MDSLNPFSAMSYPELVGRRKDNAKMIQAAIAARKAGERENTLIGAALDSMTSDNKQDYEPSDHAVIRYLERVKGVDIEAVRQEIRQTCRDGQPIMGERLKASNGHIYIVNGEGFITTIMPLGAILDEVAGQQGARNNSGQKGRRRFRLRKQLIEDYA